MEKVGLYGETEENMNRGIGLFEQGCTTCPEEPENARSECHAWSALLIDEFIRCMAGIRCARPGWEEVRIEPHMEYLPDLDGQVVTPKGNIEFSYKKTGGETLEDKACIYKIALPKGVNCIFVYITHKEKKLQGG